jgi:hypothetical protein
MKTFVYYMAIWYNSWPFGKVCGHLVYFPHFGPRKIWQPCNRYTFENISDVRTCMLHNWAEIFVCLIYFFPTNSFTHRILLTYEQ